MTEAVSQGAYRITSNWAGLADFAPSQKAFAHHGLVLAASGELIGFIAGSLVAVDKQGRLSWTAETELVEGHGITLVHEGGQDYLWVSDPGFAINSSEGEGSPEIVESSGKGLDLRTGRPRVAKLALDGTIVAELDPPPPTPRYLPEPRGVYLPTGSAVDEQRFGGSGDIWVADGYGSNLVHRYDKSGAHLATLSGEEGGGRFYCPHAVFIDRRKPAGPELYIADRGNGRVQVYDLDGQYLRTIGENYLHSPSAFAVHQDTMIIAELFARVSVIDLEDRFLAHIGEGLELLLRRGWPNTYDEDGYASAPAPLPSGKFNSPHSVAVDAEGTIFVAEWLIGGRYSKITTVGQP